MPPRWGTWTVVVFGMMGGNGCAVLLHCSETLLSIKRVSSFYRQSSIITMLYIISTIPSPPRITSSKGSAFDRGGEM